MHSCTREKDILALELLKNDRWSSTSMLQHDVTCVPVFIKPIERHSIAVANKDFNMGCVISESPVFP
jgi:hypothetical protein